MSKCFQKKQKGQTLIAIVALMVLALGIGVSLSSHLINNLKNFTRTSDLAKAQGVSEALLERILTIPNETLDDYILHNSCGSNCAVQIDDADNVEVSAQASLSYAGNSTSSFTTNLTTVEDFQLNLISYPTGQPLSVCWDSPASIYASYIYDNSGAISADVYAYNATNTQSYGNGFSISTGGNGHISCFTITARYTPQMLRLRAYYLSTSVSIYPSAGITLPKQGILITSIGKAGLVTATVRALKTSAVVPSMFDYAIFQRSSSEPLSNVSL